MVRLLLIVVGLAYWALAAWCAMLPAQTSVSVGFELRPGSGQSEYFTVYGGLQFGLGCLFLWPWIRPEATDFALASCLLLHGSIVLFRAISLALYTGLQPTTYVLIGVEWAILIASLICWWKS